MFETIMNFADNNIDLMVDYDDDNMDCMDMDSIIYSRNCHKTTEEHDADESSPRKLDSVVKSVIKKFKRRARIGFEKYGTDLDREDLTFLDWIQHAQEEHMDAILYLEKIKKTEETRLASTSSENTVYLYVAIYVLSVICLLLSMHYVFDKIPV